MQWFWRFGDGSISSGKNITHRYKKAGIYDVELISIANNGCASEPAKNTVYIYETNAFAGNDTVIAENQTLMLNGSGGEILKWSPSAGLDADNIPNPSVSLTRDAQYILRAESPAGCATTDTINIRVFKGPAFYVPSAFSPNNDGKNDRFQFIAVGITKVDLFRVFNRFGQMIYSSTDRNGWDGRSQGRDLPAGAYVWMIKGVDFQGQPHFKKGTVVLVR
jgi:gliding motility-associated-like protein